MHLHPEVVPILHHVRGPLHKMMSSDHGRMQIWDTMSGTQVLALYDILRKCKPEGRDEPSIPELNMSSQPKPFIRLPPPGIRPSSSRSFEPVALASPASTERLEPESVPMNPPTGTAEITPVRTPNPSKQSTNPPRRKNCRRRNATRRLPWH